MSWSLGERDGRDIGYGVPAYCDSPKCNAEIDRGLAYVCGGGCGDDGCGLFFCGEHRDYRERCTRCANYRKPYEPKPDHTEWIEHKLTDESWKQWRDENPAKVIAGRLALQERCS